LLFKEESMKNIGKILIIFVAVFVAAGNVMAQTTHGDIQGTVTDEAGAPLPGVTVSISSAALIGAKSAISDGDGDYKFLVLPPGDYSVAFNLPGFQARSQENLRVSMGTTTRVDAVMTPAFSDEVVVTSETPLVNTQQTTIGADLSSDFYDDLPTGRNYTAVASVTPGAQADDSRTPRALSSASRVRSSTSSSSTRSRSRPVRTMRSMGAPPAA
jgi:hypothetical protein